MFRLVGKKFRM